MAASNNGLYSTMREGSIPQEVEMISVGAGMLGRTKHAVEVNRDDLVEDLQIIFKEVAGHGDARVVDQGCYGTNVCLDLVEHCRDRRRITHVTHQPNRVFDRRGRLSDTCFIDVGENDAVAILGQCLRTGQTNTLSRSVS